MRAALALLLLASRAPAAPARSNAVTTAQETFQSVVVKPGDTLWGISNKYLKDPARWDELLKHNRLPTSDPTVALPGMTLRVPVRLIKTSLRAAHLVYSVNRVLFRRRDKPDWKGTSSDMELFQGDSLRTLEESKARVKFLNKEILSLEPNSMAVIKPSEDEDVELRSGSIFTGGRARVVTASARVTPRTFDTRFSASVEADLTTRVEVIKGVAEVDAQGSKIAVPAGMGTRVRPGLAPELPKPIANLPDLEARAQEFASALESGGGIAASPRAAPPPPEPEADADILRGEVQSLKIGQPISAYRVQASRDREFKQVLFDKTYDVEDRFAPADANLPKGAYWWRTSTVDLLGVEGRFNEPRYYSVGIKLAEKDTVNLAEALTIFNPPEKYNTQRDNVQIIGVLRDDRLKVDIDGRPIRLDADGNFIHKINLNPGVNNIVISVSDGKGNVTRLSRRVTRL